MGDGIPAKKNISNISVNSNFLLVIRDTTEPMLFVSYSICTVLLQHEPHPLYILCSLFFLIHLPSTKDFLPCCLLNNIHMLHHGQCFLLRTQRFLSSMRGNAAFNKYKAISRSEGMPNGIPMSSRCSSVSWSLLEYS